MNAFQKISCWSALTIGVGVALFGQARPVGAATTDDPGNDPVVQSVTNPFSLLGQGTVILSAPQPDLNGDTYDLQIAATTSSTGATSGEFHVFHNDQGGTPKESFSGTISCLQMNGANAVATGTITSGGIVDPRLTVYPKVQSLKGQHVGFAILDNGPTGDVLGVQLSYFPVQTTIAPCAVSPLLSEAIAIGNFTFKD